MVSGRDQQHPVGQVQAPLTARPPISDRVTTTAGDLAHQLPELTGLQAGERTDPLRVRSRDHLHPTMINYRSRVLITGLRDIP